MAVRLFIECDSDQVETIRVALRYYRNGSAKQLASMENDMMDGASPRDRMLLEGRRDSLEHRIRVIDHAIDAL